jgi:hypothetical protein
MPRFLVITMSVAGSGRYGTSGGFVVVRSARSPYSDHARAGERFATRDMIESQPHVGGNYAWPRVGRRID